MLYKCALTGPGLKRENKAINRKDTDPKVDFVTVSKSLLYLANRGEPSSVFLRGASEAILKFTGAIKLELWLEDGGKTYRWQATAGTAPVFQLKLCEAGASAAGFGQDIRTGENVVVPFEIDSHNNGLLHLHTPRNGSVDCQGSCQELAQLLGVAISNRRTRAALMERVKELDCMYRIAHIAAEPNISLDDMLQEIVDLLPGAWQFPDMAVARITLGQTTFCSAEFTEGTARMSADIKGHSGKRGTLEMFYRESLTHGLDDIRMPDDELFLKEEQHLLEGVARELNSIIDHKQAEEEKLHLQKQVRRADRLVTIGQLAAGVAHELNEPLGNILGFAQLAGKSPGLPDQVRGDLGKIEKASLYAREIIRKLMFFSRQAPSHMVDFELREVVDDSLSLLEARCAATGVKVVLELEPDMVPVNGDPSQLQQVMVNLIVNAIHAMPGGGTLTIRTEQGETHQSLIVTDTGTGIAADDIKNVFLPFFTTKEVGEGTGLGLSVVHGIIESHGGTVAVESEVGVGTTFVVCLPISVNSEGDGNDS